MRHLIVGPVVTRSVAVLAVLAIASAVASSQPNAGPARVPGQSLRLTDRGPVFYAVVPDGPTGTHAVRVEAQNVAVLRQRIGVDMEAATIPDALAVIGERSGLRFAYDRATVPVDARVTLRAQNITVAAALAQVLLDMGVDVELQPSGVALLVPRGARPADAPTTGRLGGRVSDAETHRAIPYATVQVEGTNLGATASDSGTYRITGLAAGTYSLTVRALGYKPVHQPVSVVADQTTIVDVDLAKSASQLDQVVVTGSVVPTEVKALPTPVTVVGAQEIANQHPRTTAELFREVVPSAIAWDDGLNPDQTSISVRGASNLNPGGGGLKVYLDGIEISNRDFAAIDPNSIDRIEVIRGPEAAAIYGSDAIGGVMQVFTKRGDGGLNHPQVDLQAAAGVVQSPYAGFHEAARQEYTAAVRGGTQTATYNFGGGYTGTGAWIPEGASSVPSVYGGVHLQQAPLTIDLSGRDFVQNSTAAVDPRLAETGFFFFTKPDHRPTQFQEQTYGTTVGLAPNRWWTSTLTAGIDRFTLDIHSSAPHLTTPADTFLFIEQDNQSKVSMAVNSSARASLGAMRGTAISAIVTVGLDHYTLTDNGFAAVSALNTTGTIESDPSVPAQPNRIVVTNTGAFAQAQIDLGEALFVTAALRGDRNSKFGANLGTPLSPRIGVSFVHAFGNTSVKMRASYGAAIHPPDPGETLTLQFQGSEQLANPHLGPERQVGGDGGIDVAFGDRGSLGVTYYNQTARDLISLALVDASVQSYQFQNVGEVKNTGVELEGTVHASRVVDVRAQYAYTRSRVVSVGPGYQGTLEVGDQVFLVPRHSAGGTLTWTPWSRTSVSAGLAYVGGWRNDDVFAELRCDAGTGPCPATQRGFIVNYPAFIKANVGATQGLTTNITAFLSVDNVTNDQLAEQANSIPALGRVTIMGLRVHY